MNVLIACEESQTVCKAFRAKGHNAFSCDLQSPSGGHPEWHVLGDATKLLKNNNIEFTTMDGARHFVGRWDLLIAHPPCTYLSNAGARHLWKGHKLNQERFELGLEAKSVFLAFLNAPVERICVENPVPSRVYELPKYNQIVQPYLFGHPYTKRTCLWLDGLPDLKPTNVVDPVATRCPSGSYSHKHGEKHRGMFTKDRARMRSKTFEGVAEAMAEQWGELTR